MHSRFEAILNDIALSSVAPNIYIRDIQVASPKMTVTRHSKALDNGSIVTNKRFDSSSVTIIFELREYDTDIYRRYIDLIAEWAAVDGYLTLSDRPDKRLYVTCTEFPVVGSMLQWTDEVSITFESIGFPYWEDSTPRTSLITATSTDLNEQGTIYKGAFLKAKKTIIDPFVEVVVAVDGTQLEWINLAADSTFLTLSGLSITTGQIIRVYYDKMHILHIDGPEGSIMNKRYYTSSDDLKLTRGAENWVSLTASCPVTASFSTRGVSL